MSGGEGSILSAVFAGLTFLRDSIKLCYNFTETYKKKRDEIDEKADTLRSHIADIEARKRDAIGKGEDINNVTQDWLGKGAKVAGEYSRIKDPSPGSWFSNCCWRCNAIEEVKKLDSRLNDVIAKVPTGEASRPRPPTCIDLKKKLEALGNGKVETLRCTIQDVKRRMEEATARDEVILSVVEHWVKTSEDLVGEHSRLIEEWDGDGLSNGCQRCKPLPPAESTSHEDRADEISTSNDPQPSRCRRCEAIEQAENLGSTLDRVISQAPSERVSDPRPSPPAAPTRIAIAHSVEMNSSAETALEEVMAALKSPGVTVVGVHGIPGVGKTTIVKKAAARALGAGGQKLFERVVFSTISGSPDLEKIQKEVAGCLGLPLGRDPASSIKDKIKRERNVLIVLDDIWKELVLSDVGIPTGEDLERWGSKIVFTTRDEHICSLMQCQKKVHLKIWSDQESRGFLKKTAGTIEDFEKIAEDVADECKGLPLALNVVAKALRDKPMKEWKLALERLRNSEHPHPHYGNEVFSSIKLSYDYLQPKARMCFLLCCLFPEDHNIRCEELARYAFGLGLFGHANSVDKVRSETGTVAEMLKDCGLLLPVDRDPNRERVKMHDVIRDVAIQIASFKEEEEEEEETKGRKKQVFIVQTRNQELQEWPLRDSYEIYTAISVISNRIHALPGTPDCPNLEILLLQDNHNLTKISSTFFDKMKALRLLDLNKIRTNLLPPSTMSLKMLRTLQINGCKTLKDFSVLGKLEKLAILSLRESVIEEVPESMGDLGNLRMLDLTLSRKIKRIPPNVLSRMASLEELYLKGSFSQWRDETDQKTINNASFYELIKLHRLTILEVDIADAKSLLNFDVKEAPKWSKFDICICGHEDTRLANLNLSTRDNVSTKKLLVDTSIKDFPGWFIEAVSKKTERVTYADAKKVNMFEEQAKGRLARLKSLMLDKYTWVYYLTWDISDSKPVFKSLEELQIYDSSIREICNGDLPEGSFESLESLMVQCCHEMGTTVLSQNFIERANNLKTLLVDNANANEVFAVHDNLNQGQRFFGNLREMRLENLYELKAVWKGPARFADFGNLKLVSVIKCEKLRNIFSVNILNGLSKLEDLWIEDCDEVEAIVGDGDEEINPETVTLRLPNLKTLCLSNLPRLANFCSQNLNLVCPVLEYIHVHRCRCFQTPDFNSSKEVHQNDDQHMKTLKKRMKQE